MNAVTLIITLFLGELCCATLSPPVKKNEKEKKKTNNKVGIMRRECIFYFVSININICFINIVL